MVGVGAADEEAEELVKLLPAVSVHGASDGPHRAEEEQALQPQRDLMDGRIEGSLSSMCVWQNDVNVQMHLIGFLLPEEMHK